MFHVKSQVEFVSRDCSVAYTPNNYFGYHRRFFLFLKNKLHLFESLFVYEKVISYLSHLVPYPVLARDNASHAVPPVKVCREPCQLRGLSLHQVVQGEQAGPLNAIVTSCGRAPQH